MGLSKATIKRMRQFAVVVGICAPLIAFGAAESRSDRQFMLNAGVETGYTNNVNLSKEKQSDRPFEVFTGVDYRNHSSAVDGEIKGRIGYRTYLEKNAADELRPDLDGNLLLQLDPNRLSWGVDGIWKQVKLFELGPESSENLGTQAVISTGPNLNLPISAATDFAANARVGYSHYSDQLDDYRIGLELSVINSRSQSTDISGNLAARTVSYRDEDSETESSGFDLFEAYLGYGASEAGRDAKVDVGGSFTDSGDDQWGFLLRAEGRWAVDRHDSVGLMVNYSLEDESSRSLQQNNSVGKTLSKETQSLGVFYERRIEGYLERSLRHSSLAAEIYAEEDDFLEGTENDRVQYGATLAVSTMLSRFIEWGGYADVEKTELTQPAADYRTYSFGATLGRKLGRDMTATAEMRHQRKSSRDEALEYDELAIFVSLEYTLPL